MRADDNKAVPAMKKILQMWKAHKVAATAFVVALIVALFFAARLAYFWVYWSDPSHRNQPIEDWMTVGYVARSYGVPRDKLAEAIALNPTPGERRTLSQLAAERGVATDTLKTELRQAIGRLQPPPAAND